jgi:uncharacterized repeat protein (TIGR03803 family)
MRHSSRISSLSHSIVRWLLLEVPVVLAISASSISQTFTVLHTFTGDDGSSPYAGVTVDRAGNLYGATKFGGVAGCDLGCGVLFKVTPQGFGGNFVPLYKFTGPNDGKAPVARLVFGPDGRLYGTTFLGGNSTINGGTVFALTPPPTACRLPCSWIKTTLWSFGQHQGNDGLRPGYGDLVFDTAGNIYGTTEEGGATRPLCGPGCGTVYMLSRSQESWSETLIYEFGDGPAFHPYAGVTFDHQGNLYGTAPYGGSADRGLIYELTSSNESWSPTILYNFSFGNDGGSPNAGLVSDSEGNLYGATGSGGTGGGGTVFELSPMGLGWAFQVLYSFDFPSHPFATLTMDDAGNLYGTTNDGGRFAHGNVFKLTRTGESWTYTSLYDFTGGSDGSSPFGSVALDAAGNLYGTTENGGSEAGDCITGHGCGVVWQIKPF